MGSRRANRSAQVWQLTGDSFVIRAFKAPEPLPWTRAVVRVKSSRRPKYPGRGNAIKPHPCPPHLLLNTGLFPTLAGLLS
jgi:hypothetical protein